MAILRLKGWDKDGSRIDVSYFSSSTKWLNRKAEELHSEVDEINLSMKEGRYIITTVLSGTKTKDDYKLKVKIKYYKDEPKHEHKENSHRQKINI